MNPPAHGQVGSALPADRTRRLREGLADWLAPVGTILAAVMVWFFAVELLQPPAYMVPSPQRVADEVTTNWSLLWTNLLATVNVAVLGLLLSIMLGLSAGFAIAWWTPVRNILLPPLIITQSIPKIAFAPIFIVWFGFGTLPKLLVVVLVTIYPLVLSAAVGVGGLERNTMLLARSIGLSGFALFRKVLFPASAPYIAGAIRVAASLALIGAVIAEYVGASAGIGVVILRAAGTQNTGLTFGAIFLCALAGSLIYVAAILLTKLWSRSFGPAYMRSQL